MKHLVKLIKEKYKLIIGILAAYVFVVSILYLGFYFFKIPENAYISFPGPVTALSEDVVMDDETNLYRVGVYQLRVIDRWDFVEYMWEHKDFVGQYTYQTFDSTREMVVNSLKTEIEYGELKIEKYDVIGNYLIQRYGEKKAVSMYNLVKFPDDSTGNSDSLAITLSLIGENEDASWAHAKEKVVITGNINANGNVLPIGSAGLKALSALELGASAFIVPKENYEEASTFINDESDLNIIPVTTIDEAIDWLHTNIQ